VSARLFDGKSTKMDTYGPNILRPIDKLFNLSGKISAKYWLAQMCAQCDLKLQSFCLDSTSQRERGDKLEKPTTKKQNPSVDSGLRRQQLDVCIDHLVRAMPHDRFHRRDLVDVAVDAAS